MATTCNRPAAAAATAAVVLAALLLQGCSATPRFEDHFGASVRANLAAQVIDPAAAANASSASGVDGTAALAARERYQRSFKESEQQQPVQLLIGGSGTK
jgi:type IV pilus biogenesis protein CpaD/CtpE